MEIFKTLYQRPFMKQVFEAKGNTDQATIKKSWFKYNIRKATDNTDTAWKEVSEKIMDGCWKLWPECIERDVAGFDDVSEVRSPHLTIWLGSMKMMSLIFKNCWTAMKLL